MDRNTTIEQACGNGDGTYNGYKLVQFLYYSTTGKRLSDAEAHKIVEEAKAKAAARRAERR